jgi:hypothetical protein
MYGFKETKYSPQMVYYLARPCPGGEVFEGRKGDQTDQHPINGFRPYDYQDHPFDDSTLPFLVGSSRHRKRRLYLQPLDPVEHLSEQITRHGHLNQLEHDVPSVPDDLRPIFTSLSRIVVSVQCFTAVGSTNRRRKLPRL